MSGNLSAPTSGPGDVSNYFPAAAGDSWTYDEALNIPQSGGLFTGISSVVVSGPVTVAGASTMAFAQTSTTMNASPVTSYFRQSGGGLTYYGNNDSQDLVTPRLVPYAQLLYPVQAGTVSNITATGLPFGTAANGDALTTTFTDTVVVADLETATVNAGVFANSAKVVETQSGTARDSVTGETVPFSSTQTTWLAPGVGIVQAQTTSMVNGVTVQSDLLQARGYTVSGVAHGLSAYSTLDANFGMANDWFQTAIASATTTHLVVAQDDSSGGSSTLRLYLTDLAGAQLATASIANAVHPAVFFDGSNYQVVYATYLGSPNQTLIQAVSPSTGALVGTATVAESNGGFVLMGVATAGSNNALLVFPANPVTTPGNVCICGVFVQPGGTVQAPGMVPLAAMSSGQYSSTQPTGLAVAFDGTNYLIAWSEPVPPTSTTAPIYALRVSPTGSPVEPAPLLVTATSTVSTSPALAFDGTNYLIAWLDNRGASGSSDPNRVILATRLSTAGGALSVMDSGAAGLAGFAVSTVSAQARGAPALAFDGQEYLAVWPGAVTVAAALGTPPANAIQAARISTSGTLTSGAGFEITVDQNGSAGGHLLQYFLAPSIAGGSNGLVAWFEGGNAGNVAITGVMVNPFAPF